jgi:hypothetical protein
MPPNPKMFVKMFLLQVDGQPKCKKLPHIVVIVFSISQVKLEI